METKILAVLVVSIAFIPAALVQASLVETTGQDAFALVGVEDAFECYQNDGPTTDGEECDASDTCEGAYHNITTNPEERTSGLLIPPDDVTDFFVAPVSSFLHDRVRFDVDVVEFEFSTHMYDADCNELGAVVDAAEAAASAAYLSQVFSGVRPFQPINSDSVAVDGVTMTSHTGPTALSTLDFRVINAPKSLTFAGVNHAIDVGQSARLCAFTGDLNVNLGFGGGNVKFDGVASAFQLRGPGVAFDACPLPPEPDANPVCGVNFCEVTVTSALAGLLIEVRYEGPLEPPSLEPQAQPASCHDGCFPSPPAGPGSFLVGFTNFAS